ncbi:hypothetical protein Bccel_2073 [Pseudobacteroides cellulosolvens ATCC 35603 = DSM 2933]|uniref:Uncharacterized protein n=1 Tax=Pseudobacteroides cellulosolvens ATCC 35603 = DSM 2933 TaxID=398512 RepID=A0A0L6JM29_9FIRM|nr:hypothetical protein [Pseudobacteroides cellulosolvens]KNY26808.1 hypothetical protein Bccel_2073 [Pseudobacteroides cellulosolvens ATCC 35603 = DSM 2933]
MDLQDSTTKGYCLNLADRLLMLEVIEGSTDIDSLLRDVEDTEQEEGGAA